MGSSGSPPPTSAAALVPWLPTSYRRSLSNKRGKKKTQSPHCHLSLESSAPSAAAVQEPNALPVLLKGLSDGGSLQGAGIRSQCRRICMALLKPAHQGGSGAYQQEVREAKVSNMPPSCFLPPHWLQHPQARGLCTGLGLWIEPAPEDVVEKEQTSSSLLVPPQLPQHPFMPAVGSGSPAPNWAVGHGSRLIPHRHQWPSAFG